MQNFDPPEIIQHGLFSNFEWFKVSQNSPRQKNSNVFEKLAKFTLKTNISPKLK
jgi:hypothetical protein